MCAQSCDCPVSIDELGPAQVVIRELLTENSTLRADSNISSELLKQNTKLLRQTNDLLRQTMEHLLSVDSMFPGMAHESAPALDQQTTTPALAIQEQSQYTNFDLAIDPGPIGSSAEQDMMQYVLTNGFTQPYPSTSNDALAPSLMPFDAPSR